MCSAGLPVGSHVACKQLRCLQHGNVLTRGAKNIINELMTQHTSDAWQRPGAARSHPSGHPTMQGLPHRVGIFAPCRDSPMMRFCKSACFRRFRAMTNIAIPTPWESPYTVGERETLWVPAIVGRRRGHEHSMAAA